MKRTMRRLAGGTAIVLATLLAGCGDSSASKQAAAVLLTTTTTPTTVAPTTTTTEPEVFRSAEGQVLKRFGYGKDQAELIMARARDLQAGHPGTAILSHVAGADELRLIELPFHDQAAEMTAAYVDGLIASGYSADLDIAGLGHATFKNQPLPLTYQAILVLPADGSLPVPPDWVSVLQTQAGGSGSRGWTRVVGGSGLSVELVDTASRSQVQTYQANAIEVKERLIRTSTLKLVSKQGPVSADDATLERAAREVDFNWRGKIVGMKMAGYSQSVAEAFVNGTDGNGGNVINVALVPGPLKIPPFDQSVWLGAPGPDSKPWG